MRRKDKCCRATSFCDSWTQNRSHRAVKAASAEVHRWTSERLISSRRSSLSCRGRCSAKSRSSASRRSLGATSSSIDCLMKSLMDSSSPRTGWSVDGQDKQPSAGARVGAFGEWGVFGRSLQARSAPNQCIATRCGRSRADRKVREQSLPLQRIQCPPVWRQGAGLFDDGLPHRDRVALLHVGDVSRLAFIFAD